MTTTAPPVPDSILESAAVIREAVIRIVTAREGREPLGLFARVDRLRKVDGSLAECLRHRRPAVECQAEVEERHVAEAGCCVEIVPGVSFRGAVLLAGLIG